MSLFGGLGKFSAALSMWGGLLGLSRLLGVAGGSSFATTPVFPASTARLWAWGLVAGMVFLVMAGCVLAALLTLKAKRAEPVLPQ